MSNDSIQSDTVTESLETIDNATIEAQATALSNLALSNQVFATPKEENA